MDKSEAEKLYDSGKEPTITRLLELDDQIKKLKKKIASLSQDSSNSSKPPSSQGPDKKKISQEETALRQKNRWSKGPQR